MSVVEVEIERYAKTLGGVAKHFDVTRDTVRKEWQSTGMPEKVLVDGEWVYDLFAIAMWRIGRLKVASRAVAENESELAKRKFLAETLSQEEDARGRKLINDLKEGKLYLADEVEQQVAALCARIKHRLEAIPDEFEMDFPLEVRAECKARLIEFIYQLLIEMSQWEIGSSGESALEEDDETEGSDVPQRD